MIQIENTVFDGLEAVRVRTEALELVVTTQVGPRIAFFARAGGENLLYWDKDGVQRGAWKLYGGHRVWITRPLGDESEDTYLPDNDPCSVTRYADGVDVCAPASPVSRIARGMEIRVEGERCVRVRNYLRNEGSMIYSGGCWSPTCVKADKEIEIPLGCGEETTWDIVYMAIPRIFAGNVTQLDDDSVQMRGSSLFVTPKGRCVKRCVRAPQGVVQLHADGYIFRKTAAFSPYLSYPMNGCNVAAFVGAGNFMAEMETFGGEEAIRPGQTIDNVERWEII